MSSFCPTARRSPSVGADFAIRLWDVATGKELRSFPATNDVESVAFAPDGKYLASAGDDRTVRLWDVETAARKCAL
jgi:WD40 repeat protein